MSVLGSAAEFRDVPAAIRDRVFTMSREELTSRAGQMAADLDQRARMIGDQLAQLDADAALVLSTLVTQTREVLSDLAKAERFSRMPEGTGSWSGKAFLRIKTGPLPDDQTLADRLRPVLESFAANPATLAPMPLLKACVIAGAGGPGAFRVRVLKPNDATTPEPVDITDLQKFSGGEKLTVCVALFCVLARLRAANAGRHGGGGTLILDNPLGTASHTQLLDLQRSAAAAAGVQLVYASGVNDLSAVGQFAHWVRLRNAPMVGIARSTVQVEETSGTAAADITAAHIGRREAI